MSGAERIPPAKVIMSRSENRKSRKRQLQASHQKSWLTGKYAVLETLRANRWPIVDLYLADTCDPEVADEVEDLANGIDVRLQNVTAERLDELCHSDHHQGVGARMGPYPYLSVETLLSSIVPDASAVPLVVVCDRIQDTFNFGAILRCCDAMGVSGVIIGETEQAGVTPQVARSSTGAVNHVSISRSESLKDSCRQLQQAGFTIASASEKSTDAAWSQTLTTGTALIVGSEAHGVSSDLLDICDAHLRIPMMGQVQSLNAAVAAGILLYEIRRQQQN